MKDDPVIELTGGPYLPWQEKAIAMRASGIGRREISLELEKSFSQIKLLFSEKCRQTRRDWCKLNRESRNAYYRERRKRLKNDLQSKRFIQSMPHS